MREVAFKRRRWRERHSQEATSCLNTHRFPVILGPDARHYLIDGHHLTLALNDEGIGELPVTIVADLGGLSFDKFWTTLESHNWTHPFDDEGRRCSYDDMPASVDDLVDDPFRSLAGALKRAGGYAKDKAPFSEFRWADFPRGRIPANLLSAISAKRWRGLCIWRRAQKRRLSRAGGAMQSKFPALSKYGGSA